MWSRSQVRKSQKQLFSHMTYFIAPPPPPPPPPQLSGYASRLQDDSLTTSFQELNQFADNEESDRRKRKKGRRDGTHRRENSKTVTPSLRFQHSPLTLKWNKNNVWISRNGALYVGHCPVACSQTHSPLWSLFSLTNFLKKCFWRNQRHKKEEKVQSYKTENVSCLDYPV